MWLKMHKQSERESYSHKKRTEATMVEAIIKNYKKKNKIELRILAAMDSCRRLVRPRQHSIANTWAQSAHRKK